MTTEATPRKCFLCGFETTSAVHRCPKCNRGLRTSQQVRVIGMALVVIGAGLSAGMAYLNWVIANIMRNRGGGALDLPGMNKQKDVNMLTAKEVASRIDAGASSVRKWAARGLFPGAQIITDSIVSYWVIPETALDGFVKPTQGTKPAKKNRGRK